MTLFLSILITQMLQEPGIAFQHTTRSKTVSYGSMRPLLAFTGSELAINVDTSATGIVRCELLDRAGAPVNGYSLDDCDRIHTANEINRVVRWQGQSDVSKLAGKTIRLRFVYRDADLYAFQFRTRK